MHLEHPGFLWSPRRPLPCRPYLPSPRHHLQNRRARRGQSKLMLGWNGEACCFHSYGEAIRNLNDSALIQRCLVNHWLYNVMHGWIPSIRGALYITSFSVLWQSEAYCQDPQPCFHQRLHCPLLWPCWEFWMPSRKLKQNPITAAQLIYHSTGETHIVFANHWRLFWRVLMPAALVILELAVLEVSE